MAEDRDLRNEPVIPPETPRERGALPPDRAERDPLRTDQAHPVGTGIGVAGGALAGAAAGVIGGPLGMAVGAVVGGAIGGAAGHAAGEAVNPTAEEAYWRENYEHEPYYSSGRRYEDYGPAYRYGMDARARHDEWDVAEPYLAADWDTHRGESTLSWGDARPAARAAWDRMDSRYRGRPDGNLHHYGTGMASSDSSYHTGPQGVPDYHAHAPEGLHPDDTTHMQSRGMGTTNVGSGSVGWGSMADTSTMTAGTLSATTGMDAGYMAGTATGHDMATASAAPTRWEDSRKLESVIETLQDLVDTCRDGQYGFERCAERVQREELQAVFRQRAEDCRVGASQLQAQIRALGGVVSGTGSTVAGDAHRGWVSAHQAVEGLDDLTVLEQAERGEDMALAHYRRALENRDLPADIRQMVERQQGGVKRNHDQVKMLRDQARAA